MMTKYGIGALAFGAVGLLVACSSTADKLDGSAGAVGSTSNGGDGAAGDPNGASSGSVGASGMGASESGGSQEMGGAKEGGGDSGMAGALQASGDSGASGEGPSVSARCNQLSVGELGIDTGVVAAAAPAPLGGALLPGTYDLERIDVYLPASLDALQTQACQGIATSDLKFRQDHESYRFTALGGGRFLLETVLVAANNAGLARGASTVHIVDGTILDGVDGTAACSYTNVAGTAMSSSTIYQHGSDFLGNDYLPAFTSAPDSLLLIEGASFPATGPAYCSRVYSFKRR